MGWSVDEPSSGGPFFAVSMTRQASPGLEGNGQLRLNAPDRSAKLELVSWDQAGFKVLVPPLEGVRVFLDH